MKLNLKKREEIFLASPPEIQKMYESGGLKLKAVADGIHITDPEQYRVFAITIGDIILGMYKKESLGQLLKDRLNLSGQQVNTVVSELHELLARIPEKEEGERFVMPPIDQSSDEALVKESSEGGSIEPIHTFESDMRGVHGYGAFAGNRNEDVEENVYRSVQDSVLTRKDNETPGPSTNYSQYSVPINTEEDDIDTPSTEPPQTL